LVEESTAPVLLVCASASLFVAFASFSAACAAFSNAVASVLAAPSIYENTVIKLLRCSAYSELVSKCN